MLKYAALDVARQRPEEDDRIGLAANTGCLQAEPEMLFVGIRSDDKRHEAHDRRRRPARRATPSQGQQSDRAPPMRWSSPAGQSQIHEQDHKPPDRQDDLRGKEEHVAEVRGHGWSIE